MLWLISSDLDGPGGVVGFGRWSAGVIAVRPGIGPDPHPAPTSWSRQ
ncbi:hypothetical protein [Gordonia sp. NPDC058843]